MYAGATLAAGAVGVGIWTTASGNDSADESTSSADPSPPAVIPSSQIPQPHIRWGLRSSTEGWQPGPHAPQTEVSHDPDGYLLAAGENQVEVSSFTSGKARAQDWRLTDRTNDDRVSATVRVEAAGATAKVLITMVWVKDVENDVLSAVDSTSFVIPTHLDVDLDTWWHCRGSAPADVLKRVAGIRVQAVATGAITMHLRDVRQPPTAAPYGPEPYGVATLFTATEPKGLPAPAPADLYARRVLTRLDGIADWRSRNRRAVHIGEWAWPKETGGVLVASSASLQGWADLAEQWMRKADQLAIPYTPWGESAYWAGVQASTGTNYGSYPDASFFCGEKNYDRTGAVPRAVNAMKPSAARLVAHMNTVDGIKPSINVVGGCFVHLRDGTEYSSTNIGVRGSDYFVENPATIDYLHSVGYRVFRLPFRWDRVMRSPKAGQLDASEWGYVRDGIEHILSLDDTAVIVDQHCAAQFWISPAPENKAVPAVQHAVDAPDGVVTTEDLVHFWELVSDDLRNHSDRLIYEITNEPHGESANPFTVKRYTQAVVTALRARGDATFCLIPSFPYDNIASAITEPNQPFAWINDPAGSHRHAYTFHHYMDSDMTGVYARTYQEEVAAHG